MLNEAGQRRHGISLNSVFNNVSEIMGNDQLVDFFTVDPAIQDCFLPGKSSDIRGIQLVSRVTAFFDAGYFFKLFYNLAGRDREWFPVFGIKNLLRKFFV